MGAADTAKGLVRTLVDFVTLRNRVHQYGEALGEQQKHIEELTERTIRLEALRDKLKALESVIKDQQQTIEKLTARSIRAEFLKDMVGRYDRVIRDQQSRVEDLTERVIRAEVRSEMQGGVFFPAQFPERQHVASQGRHGERDGHYLPAGEPDGPSDDEEVSLGLDR